MRIPKIFSIVFIFTLLFVLTIPANAQLGDTDTSSFAVQNVSGNDGVSVTIKFIAENGTEYSPTDLGGGLSNPFTLDDGESKLINVEDIPSAQLPSARYSLVVSSTDKVVVVASVAGDGTKRFTGSYSGFSTGATTTYLASTAYQWYGWYSMISVMNLGSGPADVTVTINCSNGTGTTGTLTQLDIPSLASHTFVLKSEVPTGFTSSTTCIGSSKITSDENVVVVNNQNVPTLGSTNTFEGFPGGFDKVYVPNLSTNYYGWVSALNVIKLGSGSTTVTIDYDDSEPNDTCNLTDTTPSCQLYMPAVHPTSGRYGAKITSSPSMELLVSVGGSHSAGNSGAYVGVNSGSESVAIPIAMKRYYNWVSAINCQNVSTTPSTLHFVYQDYPGDAYNHPTTLNEGDSIQVYVPTETFLPDGYFGGVIVSANTAGAEISCVVGTSIEAGITTTPGDWTYQYNAIGK